MKKLISIMLCTVIALSVVSIPTFSVKAGTSQIVFCGIETDESVIPGNAWLSDDGNMLHMRGQTTYSTMSPMPGHPECDPQFSQGRMEMTVNLNLNLITGEGEAWGYTTVMPTGMNGTFAGSFEGKIHGFAFLGYSTTPGTGDLKGMIEKVTIQQTSANTYDVNGIVIGR